MTRYFSVYVTGGTTRLKLLVIKISPLYIFLIYQRVVILNLSHRVVEMVVFVVQLTARSLPIPEDPGWKPGIGKLN